MIEESERKMERTRYLWGVVRSWVRTHRLLNRLNRDMTMKQEKDQQGINMRKNEFQKLFLMEQEDSSYKCWVEYNSLIYKIWIGIEGLFLCLQLALVPYIMATNDNNLIDDDHYATLSAIFVYQILDMIFNIVSEKMVDVKIIKKMVKSSQIYLK